MSQQSFQNEFAQPPPSIPIPNQAQPRKFVNLQMLKQIMKQSKIVPQNLRQEFLSNNSKYEVRGSILALVMNCYLIGNILCRKQMWFRLTTNWGSIARRFFCLYFLGGFNNSLENLYQARFHKANQKYFQDNWERFAQEFGYKSKLVEYRAIKFEPLKTQANTVEAQNQPIRGNLSNVNSQQPPSYISTSSYRDTTSSNYSQNPSMNSTEGYDTWGGQFNAKSNNQYSSNKY